MLQPVSPSTALAAAASEGPAPVVNSTPPTATPQLELTGSRQFTAWLAEQRLSLGLA